VTFLRYANWIQRSKCLVGCASHSRGLWRRRPWLKDRAGGGPFQSQGQEQLSISHFLETPRCKRGLCLILEFCPASSAEQSRLAYCATHRALALLLLYRGTYLPILVLTYKGMTLLLFTLRVPFSVATSFWTLFLHVPCSSPSSPISPVPQLLCHGVNTVVEHAEIQHLRPITEARRLSHQTSNPC
jgi:hypothetical protein